MGDQRYSLLNLKMEKFQYTFMTGIYDVWSSSSSSCYVHEAKSQKRKICSSIMASAALTLFNRNNWANRVCVFFICCTSIICNTLFISGLSYAIMQLLGVKIGFIFRRIIDFLLFGVLPNRTPWYLAILVGIGFAVLYYSVFRFMIRKFNLKTPGREDESETNTLKSLKCLRMN